MRKKKLDITVISDIHLGTYGCHAKELHLYLQSIDPEILILNGDIIDIWQFSKRYWPEDHMKVVEQLFKMLGEGVKIYYLTGNHDEMLRRFSDFKLGNLEVLDKLILERDGQKMWFFHGDIFDITMKYSKWLAKLGGWGYDLLILLNRMVNYVLVKGLRKNKISLSKRIKNSVKSSIKFIDDFEQTAIDLAIESGYSMVFCGHIHQPGIREIKTPKGSTTYLNSGDWVENLTALEYVNAQWSLFAYEEEP
ncbi:MAG: UDP-2,3-diacylglucosamine diphosphatase, partial [Bacteroidota bacterium]|nr:UDP-2,3-diacylglucosamine diphosphatase [Bacteroidota bacterium]MDX5430731.1 UDP-2,3-diacylglucosamine diphosphatase [Bacteroidota bacterium]MDX5469478.1 UDP-2,3-diacylglucosamine diphosphatase [Bacteroidota bacterium]